MIKLTEQQRNFLVKSLTEYITDTQVSDRYYYEHEAKTLVWVSEERTWLLLDHNTNQFDWIDPSDIDSVVDNFTDATLHEWFCDEQDCSAEDFEEYITDELETA